jgi:O-antigen/teichoic acid export membrane protein
MNTMGLAVPLIFVAAHFGAEAAGQFGMAERILGAPATLVIGTASQVLAAEIAKRRREGRHGVVSLFLRASAVLGGIGLVLCAIAWLAAGPAVRLFVGEQWTEASTLLQVMAVTVAVRLAGSPAGTVLIVLEDARMTVLLDVMRVVLLAAAIVLVINLDLALVPATWCIYGALFANFIAYWLAAAAAVRTA